MDSSIPRPMPTIGNADIDSPWFEPSADLNQWAHRTFIEADGPLHNPAHAHLEWARIGFMWTRVANSRRGRQVVGQAEAGKPTVTAGKWMKARIESQVRAWFGDVPDFLITLDADYAVTCTDLQFCALVEHELMHCGVARDAFGAPQFTQEGRPKFSIVGHDVEEFIGIIERYGAPDETTQRFIDAGKQAPRIGRASIAHACGNCLKVA